MKVTFSTLVMSTILWPQLTWAACNITLNPGDIGSAVTNALAGSTVCLNPGSYSMLYLTGVAKNPRVTVQSTSGRGAILAFEIRNGTSGFIFDNLTLRSGYIFGNDIRDITISQSDFIDNGKMVIDGVIHSNILLDGNTHRNINVSGTGVAGRVSLPYGGDLHSGVTVQNSEFDGGCADGIQAGVGLNIYNNRFMNMKVGNCLNDPHTDAIQFVGATGSEGPHIKGNYFYNNEQVLTAFDQIANALIEDNVFDPGPFGDGRPWQIEWYSDTNSVIRHNTILYRPTCEFKVRPCGQIYVGHKAADPAGKGTVIVDNIVSAISINNGSTVAKMHNNLVRTRASAADYFGVPTYIGGAIPASWEGFQLAAGSLGFGKGSDGLNIGSRFFGRGPAP